MFLRLDFTKSLYVPTTVNSFCILPSQILTFNVSLSPIFIPPNRNVSIVVSDNNISFSLVGNTPVKFREDNIMQITRDNYSQYANMVQQMFGNRKNSNDPLAQCDYGNFALRFKPVDIKFTKPNWDNIMTKRDKPAMSEEEFEEAIKDYVTVKLY